MSEYKINRDNSITQTFHIIFFHDFFFVLARIGLKMQDKTTGTQVFALVFCQSYNSLCLKLRNSQTCIQLSINSLYFY